ncbi:MAG: putative cytokinetic ring protein SteA [Thermincola ferriacetica]
MLSVKGIARVDKKTKHLVQRLEPGNIAIINHQDLDEVCAEALAKAKVKMVVNAAQSISGKYPNQGPMVLAEAGILILDNVGEEVMAQVEEGAEVEISGNRIRAANGWVGSGTLLTKDEIARKMEETKKNLGSVLSDFVQNTLEWAQQEQQLVLGKLPIPETTVDFTGRHTLIVVRGQNYKEDLLAIKSYIEEVRPVLIGVDGGADALREFGYCPDIIIGDMDSISDDTLRCGAEIIVHAYPDGRAPGLARVQKLGLDAKTFPAPGTSEDIAMLLAYEKGTELIVAVGTHSNMIDFLEKGRKGMASTFLVRLKVGSILVDARGVNKLYRRSIKFKHLAFIVLAALIPFAVVAVISPTTSQFLRLVWIKMRLVFGL